MIIDKQKQAEEGGGKEYHHHHHDDGLGARRGQLASFVYHLLTYPFLLAFSRLAFLCRIPYHGLGNISRRDAQTSVWLDGRSLGWLGMPKNAQRATRRRGGG